MKLLFKCSVVNFKLFYNPIIFVILLLFNHNAITFVYNCKVYEVIFVNPLYCKYSLSFNSGVENSYYF